MTGEETTLGKWREDLNNLEAFERVLEKVCECQMG